MIRINNVSFRYANADEFAIRDINITVHKGEFLVLLGESGCGKTTITRLINRLVPEFYEGDLSGKVLIIHSKFSWYRRICFSRSEISIFCY